MIRRRRQHLAQLDKDCYYLQILQKGHAQLVQGRHELPSNQAVAAMFYSGEPYDLQCRPTSARSIWRSRVKA